MDWSTRGKITAITTMNNQVLNAMRRITNRLDSDFTSVYRALATADSGTVARELVEVNDALLRMGRHYRNLFLVGIDAERRAIMTVDRFTRELQYRNQLTFVVEETASLNELPMHQATFVNELLASQTAQALVA